MARGFLVDLILAVVLLAGCMVVPFGVPFDGGYRHGGGHGRHGAGHHGHYRGTTAGRLTPARPAWFRAEFPGRPGGLMAWLARTRSRYMKNCRTACSHVIALMAPRA